MESGAAAQSKSASRSNWQNVAQTDKARYVELLNLLLSQVADAYASGLVMKNDLLKVKVKRIEELLSKSKLPNGRTLALMAFFQHLVVPYDSMLVLKDTLGGEPTPRSLYVDHAVSLRNRAEHALLEASVRAGELQSDVKLGECLSQIGIGLTGVLVKLDENRGRTIRMAFGTASIPISGGWEASSALTNRSANEKIAENTLKENATLLLLQMEKAWLDLSEAYRQVSLSEEAKMRAEENLNVGANSYRNGIVAVSDLLEAQAQYQQSLDGLTDAKSYRGVKKTIYLQATGR